MTIIAIAVGLAVGWPPPAAFAQAPACEANTRTDCDGADDGAPCSSGRDCRSTFCADGVCCNSACDRPFDTCNAPPQPGTCVQVAPTPPVGRRGLLTGLALLTLIGAAALWHHRRPLGSSSA